MKCILGNGNSLKQTRALKPLRYLCPNYRRSLAVKNAMDDFLSKVRVGLGCVHSFDDTVEPGIFQILGCDVCEMALLP